METPTPSRARFAALRHRDFRLFWLGQLLSTMGSQFTTVAMAWQIYELTNSPFHIGMLGLSRAIPQMGLLLFGGLLADALDRRRLLIATQAVQLLVSATLVWITLTGAVSPLALYGSTVLLALSLSLENPARQSLTPNLVPRVDLTNALALTITQRQVAMIAGPSIAGVVLAFSGPALCYAVDGVSWLAMIVTLCLIRARPQAVGGMRGVSLRSMREGIHFVWNHSVILLLMLLDFGMTLLASTGALMPVFARDILLVGPQGLGILFSATAMGSVLTAAVMSTSARVRRTGAWVLTGVATYGLCTALFGLSNIFWLSVLMLGGTGVGNTISTVLRHTINQLATPDELRGRVASVNGVFTSGGPQLGQFVSGVVATLIGAPLAAVLGGVATLALVAGFALAAPVVRRFRITEGSKPAEEH